MNKELFRLEGLFELSIDQKNAVSYLTRTIEEKNKYQVLKGVTGCGKTFTVANIIQNVQMPVLVLVHNKSLAKQLYENFKSYFPDNKVELFMSCFDYFRPEFFLKSKNVLMEKESIINDEMDSYRMSALRTLLSGRQDVIVVASVSCLYSIGDPDAYVRNKIVVESGMECDYDSLLRQLVLAGYEREDEAKGEIPLRGSFRATGENLIIRPGYGDKYYTVSLDWDIVESITERSADMEEYEKKVPFLELYPQRQGLYSRECIKEAVKEIGRELEDQYSNLVKKNKKKEADTLKERVEYDMQMLSTTGSCKGMDNYSYHFMRQANEKKRGLIMELFPCPFLTVIDESHATVPQMKHMLAGDEKRKEELIEQGIRLPSIKECRPVSYEEFEEMTNQILFVSATPGEFEFEKAQKQVVTQTIRPTFLLDPLIEVRNPALIPWEEDIINEIKQRVESQEQTIIMADTKQGAEEVNAMLCAQGIHAGYIHSDLNITERVYILNQLYERKLHCIVGVNSIREGLDFPDVSLVIILRADKKGFLRTPTALMQMIGRATRNMNGQVIMYAEAVTDAMKQVIDETEQNRRKQEEFNRKKHVAPSQITRKARKKETVGEKQKDSQLEAELQNIYGNYDLTKYEDRQEVLVILKQKLVFYAEEMEFAKGIQIRQEIDKIEGKNK